MKKTDIKLIALDLDDTTLHSDTTLSEPVASALIRAIETGIVIAVASGRSFRSLPQTVLDVKGIGYAITSNGAAVHRLPDGKKLVSRVLRERTVRDILSVFEGETMECFIDGQAYCDKRYYDDPADFGCSRAYINYIKTTRRSVEDMTGFMLENINCLDSIDILGGKVPRKDELWAKAEKIDGVYVTSSSPRLIELCDRDAGKVSGVRFLCEALGIAPEQCMTFGNGDNDAEMLRFAGIGVAVGNATKTCLDAADIIGPTNNEDCVAKILEEVLGI